MKRTHILSGLVVILVFCLASSAFAVTTGGWADMNGGVTGGAGGTVVTVSTPADFNTYVTSPDPYIVQVSGTISLTPIGYKVYIASNKTIRGIDTNSKIIGNLAFQQYASNVIIENLTITNPTTGELYSDGISVKENVSNVFITHCTFYDCGDGCLDITEESDFVTVSWCKFYYVSQSAHNNVCLVGHVDTNTDDIGHLRVTFHHNWWSTKCMERMPRVRYGQAHVYNNYYDCHDNNYCVGVGVGCQIRFENNYLDNVRQTWYNWNNYPTYPMGIIGWNTGPTGNQFVNGTTVATWAPNDYNSVFVPPYSYTMDDGPDVKDIVMPCAGNVECGDITPPDVPTGLAVVLPGEADVPLDWDDNNEADLAGYNVYRSETSGGAGFVKLNGSLLTSSDYIDNITTHDTTYYYVVTAVDTNSNESDYSEEVFGGLYGDFTGNGIVEIDDLPDFLDFWLQTDCGLTEGLDLDDNCIVNFYEFSVFANNWQVIPPDITPPVAPTGLSATAGDVTVSLDWDDNGEADLAGYNIYRSETSGSDYVLQNVSLLTSSDYTDNSVANGTTYYYFVKAVDMSSNESDSSAEASATPHLPATDIELLGSWATGLTHAKEAGFDRALIFIAHCEHSAAVSLTVTYGGQPMTKVIDVVTGTSGFRNYVAAFILDEAGIAAATNGTFVPSWSPTPTSVTYASVFLQNVDQTNIIGATDSAVVTTGTTVATDPLNTNDGDMVILGAVSGNNGSYTLNNGFTEGTDESIGSSGHTGVTGHKSATGADETPSATHSTSYRQAIIGFVVQAAIGG